jgi:hypothetical protein
LTSVNVRATSARRRSGSFSFHVAEQLDVPLRDRNQILPIESFFPADAETAAAVGAFAGRPST